MMTNRKTSSCLVSLLFSLVAVTATCADEFQAAVITLVFPPGARATGLGEAFTALSNDANATYFNPAGLGMAPLANSWKVHLSDTSRPFTAIAARKAREFSLEEAIWVGTPTGVRRFNGKVWENADIQLVEPDDELTAIASDHLESENDSLLDRALWIIREENNIEMKRFEAIRQILMAEYTDSSENTDTAVAADNATGVPQSEKDVVFLARSIIQLAGFERDSATVAPMLADMVDEERIPSVVSAILEAFKTDDITLETMVEIRIPFSIAFTDSVTCCVLDSSEQLWVGTSRGLWRYDESRWQHFGIQDGLPSNMITCLTVGPYNQIGVGTDAGVAVREEGLWNRIEIPDTSVGPRPAITALTYAEPTELYIGTETGLFRKNDSTWIVYDTGDGLLTTDVSALFYDSEKTLWIGGSNGVTLYDRTTWKRYRFPDSKVYSFAEQSRNRVWIGTNRGAIAYRRGRTKVDNDGNVVEDPPEWKPFHSKNALTGNNVSGLATHGRDIWLTTEEGINQYDHAEREVLLFWELLLPKFKLRDLWHSYMAMVYPTEDWGTLGLLINFINFGENTWTDEDGRTIAKFRSWEGVFGVSYGLALKEDFSFGLNLKYIHSALAPGIGPGSEGVGRSFAVDASILKRNLLIDGLDLGFTLQNMGPSIYYIEKELADPIYFSLKFGTAYRILESQIHTLTALMDLNRGVYNNEREKDPDPFYTALYTDIFEPIFDPDEGETARGNLVDQIQRINVHLGLEYWYLQFLAGRMGFLFDYIGERYELTLGLGIKYGNLNFDFSYIHSPEGFFKNVMRQFVDDNDTHANGSWGVRHGQPRFSLIVRF